MAQYIKPQDIQDGEQRYEVVMLAAGKDGSVGFQQQREGGGFFGMVPTNLNRGFTWISKSSKDMFLTQ